tara:strand:- start:620 stop:1186 length:567 start_codon:yes stop_codon:yes gene_type:complete
VAKRNKLTKELAEKIRIQFVQGIDEGTSERRYQTLDALATENNIARATLYRWSKKENWKSQQERFHEEFLQKVDAERTKQLIADSKKFDSNALSLAKILLNEVGMTLQMNQQYRQNGDTKRILSPVQLSQLSNSALTAQKLGKLALGESTENMKLNAEISDTDAFRGAMELLDEVAEQRRKADDSAVH